MFATPYLGIVLLRGTRGILVLCSMRLFVGSKIKVTPKRLDAKMVGEIIKEEKAELYKWLERLGFKVEDADVTESYACTV